MILDSKEIKYIVDEIKDWQKHISHISHQSLMNKIHSLTPDKEHSDEYIIRGLEFLYNHICVYFEARSMREYLLSFKYKFEPLFKEKDKLLDIGFLNPDEPSPELLILDQFRKFLSPFKVFDYKNDKDDENDKLISILKETPFILKKIPISKKSEVEIYKQVHWVLKLYYHSCRVKSRSLFLGIFKIYEPDILVPELRTAIEFKLVRKKSNIDDYIDQIKIDATNYKDDTRYNNFIAVLCIEDRAVSTERNILESWKLKNFPKNWTLVVAFI